MEIKHKRSGASLFIYVYGDLDEFYATSAREVIDKVVNENLTVGRIIFDLSGVNFIDSTGIGLLIGRYKKIKEFDIPCYISGASVATEKVLVLSGIYSIMPKF